MAPSLSQAGSFFSNASAHFLRNSSSATMLRCKCSKARSDKRIATAEASDKCYSNSARNEANTVTITCKNSGALPALRLEKDVLLLNAASRDSAAPEGTDSL